VLNPRNVEACRHYVYAVELLGRVDDASGAWFSLGAALEAEERFPEAAVAYQQAVAHKPDCLRALVKLGQAYVQLAKACEALPCFEAALAINPTHNDACVGVAWCHQLLGDISFGWADFAWWTGSSTRRRDYLETPAWDGSSLKGRTILLWCDGGLGDHLHLFRYIPVLKALGARVIVECARRLVPLAQQIEGADVVITRRMPLPRLDFHAPLILLPGVLHVTRDTVPGTPYMTVSPALVDEWRQRLCTSTDKTVGITWASGAATGFRSAPLAAYGALADVKGIRFINLQQGKHVAELASGPRGLHVEVIPEESRSICDTAALMMNLDLIISVDTMAAHLGGGLARPTWTLLPHAPNWRWHAEGDTTPWYSTMRLFRQTHLNDWSDVFQRVRSELEAFVETGNPLPDSHPI
jgi:hypothetical protein